MGSWYNLEGEALAKCITRKCGMMPSPLTGIAHSPQQRAKYEAKKAAWLECKNKCQGSLLGTSVRVPYGQVSSQTTPDASGGGSPLPAEQPTGENINDNNIVSKISPNMKIGLVVGAAAVIGLWLYFRRK